MHIHTTNRSNHETLVRALFACVLCFVCVQIFSQETNDTTKKKLGVSMGAWFSPDINYRYLRDNRALDGPYSDKIGPRNQQEQPQIGYSAGAIVRIKLTNRIHVNSGFNYTVRGFTSQISHTGTDPNSSKEPIDNITKHVYQLYEIPLTCSVLLFQKKRISIAVNLGTGVAGLINKKRYVRITYEDGSKANFLLNGKDQHNFYEDYSKHMLFGSFGLEVNYHATQRLSLGISPTFQYYITAVYHSPVKEHLYGAGGRLIIAYVL